MATNATPPNNVAGPHGLPPVKPPSGRFIVQLFLLPGLIVTGLVMVFVFGGLSWVGSSTPESLLAKLDNPNPDIRWRAAHELAQVLKRRESLELASNPDFALDIADRLRKANDELNKDEWATGKELFKTKLAIESDKTLKSKDEITRRQDQAAQAAWRKLSPQRNLVLFLISCCGDFTLPTCVPVLSEIAVMNDGAEEKGMSLRKRRAVWALANLGDNMNRRYFGKDADLDTKALTDQQKTTILEKLAKIGTEDDERAKMARYAFGVLTEKLPSGVDKVLASCANHEDIFLREVSAMAFNFWDGPLAEPTLLLLSKDEGKGKRIYVTEAD